MFIDAFRAFFTVDLQPGRCPKFQAAFVHSSFLHQHKSSCCHKSHPGSCLNEEHAHTLGLSVDLTVGLKGQAAMPVSLRNSEKNNAQMLSESMEVECEACSEVIAFQNFI